MNTRSIALIGAALLVLGAFAPIVSLPLVGHVTPMQDGRSFGWIWLVLAGAGAHFAVREDDTSVKRIGLASFATAMTWLAYILIKLSDARAVASKELEGNMFRAMADAAMGSIHFQWGWAALFIGAGTLIYAGSFAEKKYLCPKCKEQVWTDDEHCEACGSLLRWIGDKVFLRPRLSGTPPRNVSENTNPN